MADEKKRKRDDEQHHSSDERSESENENEGEYSEEQNENNEYEGEYDENNNDDENNNNNNNYETGPETKKQKVIDSTTEPNIDPKTIMIRNITKDTKEEDLRNKFSTFGTITRVSIPLYRQSGEPRGFAFIEFEEEEASKSIMEEGEFELLGNNLEIKQAEYDNEKVNRPVYTAKVNQIYVGNVPPDVKEDELEDLFKDCGAIKEVRIPHRGGQKRFAFVHFEEVPSVKIALGLDGTELRGSSLTVREEKSSEKRKRNGSRGGLSGGRGGPPVGGAPPPHPYAGYGVPPPAPPAGGSSGGAYPPNYYDYNYAYPPPSYDDYYNYYYGYYNSYYPPPLPGAPPPHAPPPPPPAGQYPPHAHPAQRGGSRPPRNDRR